MDRTELQQKLTQPFNPDQWKEVVETVFPGSQFYAQARTVATTEEMVEQIVDKGTVRLADGKNIALVELRLKSGSVHLHKNRVKLRSLVAKLIDQERAHGVIAVFEQGSGDYRLSFVAREAVLEDGEFKTRETPPKRFTYLLGPGETCRTAAERLYILSQKQELSLDDVTDAFSVEKLNKEFYRHIQKYFYELVGGKVDQRDYTGCMSLPDKPIEADENHKAYSEFAVRLLGRVVFCWFLKHKRCDQNRPLIPEELLSSKAVEANDGYYHKILEKLFFQTLNKPMNERSKYAPEFAHLIPYLNGGLFDPHKDDFYEEGALGESKYINTLIIPDDWFLRFFQTLEMYNFTIDENTALDTDVSIDPEILGRIFENLLAEINPETGDSARKATGSFYTPREIVDYMVEESLLQHLKTALNNEDAELVQKLRALFIDDDEPTGLDKNTEKAVIDAFRTIKVLDPACGSGAFPVGILQKMLCALRKVDPENDLWLVAQFEQIESMKLNKAEEDRRLREIEEAFKTNEADYGRKLGIIQNSVYGVDIQPIAIEISKLRFFLTLVVDEKINENAPKGNRGILPLPNLDFKFVCANTLIPAPEIENQGDELDLEYYPDFFEDFTHLTEQYFYAGTPAEKQALREQLSDCVGKKIHGELDKVHALQGFDLFALEGLSKAKQKKIKDRREELVRNISLWESYKNIFTGEAVGFFDPKYMFPDAGDGFDVVIANPPYIGEKGHKKLFSEIKNGGLGEYYLGKADIFYFFFHFALNVSREGACISFITTNYFPTADGGRKLRADIRKRAEVLGFINLGELKLFAAAPGQHNMITILSKTSSQLVVARNCITKRRGLVSDNILRRVLRGGDPLSEYFDVSQDDLYDGENNYIRLQGTRGSGGGLPHSILNKLSCADSRLEDLCVVNIGMRTGADKVSQSHLNAYKLTLEKGMGLYVLTDEERIDLGLNDAEQEMLLPFFKNSNVRKYFCDSKNTLWLIDLTYPKCKDIDWERIPNIRAHIFQFEKILKNRRSNDNGLLAVIDAGYWWCYTMRQLDFSAEKIVSPQRSMKNTFALSSSLWVASMDVYFITQRVPDISLRYVLALLNSQLYYFWMYHRGKRKGEALELYQRPLSELPIKYLATDKQKPFLELVDRINSSKQQNPEANISALEAEIDQLVYKLYDLTPEEIAIVEGAQ